jgi:hypothetical protein
MRLLTYHPQNLGAALDENLPLLLNSRCIDPVFRIVYSLSTCFRGGKNPVAASDGFVEHLLFWERIAAKVTYFISVIAGEGLLDDQMLPAVERPDGKYLMRRGRTADIYDIHCITKLFEGIERADTFVSCERFA